MKSIKPGRGPSFKNGVAAVGAALFGVFWIIIAISMGGWFMAPFGLIFIGISVYEAIYSFKNATSKNRYSVFDITEEGEETDPFDARFGEQEKVGKTGRAETDSEGSRFCPWCGEPVDPEHSFCSKCGKKLN